MTFSVNPRCGVPASWAARHTIVCLDKNSDLCKKNLIASLWLALGYIFKIQK